MTREEEIRILMKDRCTRKEAITFLKHGTIIYDGDDFEKNFDKYINEEWEIEEDYIPEYRQMVTDKIPVNDWSIVECDGKTYYIAYVIGG